MELIPPRSSGLVIATLFALAAAAAAQQPANDYAGISMTASGVSPATNRVSTYPPCGLPFDCNPRVLQAQGGDALSFFVMGTFNGLYILAASLDTATPVCLPLGVPGLANDLVWLPGPTLLTLSVGVCSVPDNGRCNGGASVTTPLFTIPPAMQGSVGFQAIVGAPLSAGGLGFAFTHAVQVNF